MMNERIIPFEESYEDIKNDPNAMWFLYEPNIAKIVSGLAYLKNFDKDDLMQQSYLSFRKLCDNYDPYY